MVAKIIGLDIIVYQVVFIILEAADKMGKRGNILYMGVYFIAISSSKHYVYAINPSQIPLPSYCLRIYI